MKSDKKEKITLIFVTAVFALAFMYILLVYTPTFGSGLNAQGYYMKKIYPTTVEKLKESKTVGLPDIDYSIKASCQEFYGKKYWTINVENLTSDEIDKLYTEDKKASGVRLYNCLNSIRNTIGLNTGYINLTRKNSLTYHDNCRRGDCYITVKSSNHTYTYCDFASYDQVSVDGKIIYLKEYGVSYIKEEEQVSDKPKASNKKKSYYHDSYDDGYDDIMYDDDYDWDRYWSDDDYASGVDDAMDDYDW